MIKYNNSNINDWNYGDDNIIKVYRNNAVCYYKVISSGGTPAQVPCYAVVDDISQYSDREFVDVYDNATDKWYKLNNLNQYEEYGVYGSGRTITYYEGKLTVDDGYEYMYSGSSWNNVGEVSGSSRVPQGYTEVEYIENSTSGTNYYIDTQFKPNQDTRVILEAQPSVLNNNPRMFGSGPWNGLAFAGNIENILPQRVLKKFYFKYGQTSTWYTTNVQADTNKHTFDLNKNSYYIDGVLANTASTSTFQLTTNLGIFNAPATSLFNDTETFIGKVFSCKIYDNGTLIRDFVPCKRDSDSKSGLYDVVNDVFYSAVNTSYNFILGAETGSTEYPLYYDEKSDPPNNLTFSSMTEAEEYECPWVGMNATIDGVSYVFSGDSQSGYEWVNSSTPPTHDYSLDYFTTVALEPDTIIGWEDKVNENSLEYSTDDGETWNQLSSYGSITLNIDEKALFRGENMVALGGIGIFTCNSGSINVEGNIMSLIHGDNFASDNSMEYSQFSSLFEDCYGLISAENLVLPATTLTQECYQVMFSGCPNLTTAPSLPAATLAVKCYEGMFYGCTSLNNITCLATDISATDCTSNWVDYVYQYGTFTKAASMTSWTTGANGIPNGWTVEDYSS